MSEKNNLETGLGNFEAIRNSLKDYAELAEIADLENDEAVLDDVAAHL